MEKQTFEHFCVLDFEACLCDNVYEVTDFPVLLLDNNGNIKDTFHMFVKPSKVDKKFLDNYVANKYGKMGLAEVHIFVYTPFKFRITVLTNIRNGIQQAFRLTKCCWH